MLIIELRERGWDEYTMKLADELEDEIKAKIEADERRRRYMQTKKDTQK